MSVETKLKHHPLFMTPTAHKQFAAREWKTKILSLPISVPTESGVLHINVGPIFDKHILDSKSNPLRY